MQCNLMNLAQCNLRQWNDMSCHCTALYCNVMYCTVCVHACKYLYVHTYLYTLCLYTCICDLDSICVHIYIYMHTDHAETSSLSWNGLPLSYQVFMREANIFLQDFPSINLFLFPGPFYMGIISSAEILMDRKGSWPMDFNVDEIHVHLGHLSQTWVYSTYIYNHIYI